MNIDIIMRIPRAAVIATALACMAFGSAQAETLSGPALVQALARGGYVIVMRHASSPRTAPTPAEADTANPQHERQLDETGRTTSIAMGAAIKALHIRIGAVWSSPTYRALETVRLAGLPEPRTATELGDNGQSMQATKDNQSSWLKAKAAEMPDSGTDTLFVTHYPNIMAAFGSMASELADGEALVFHPVGKKGAADLVGRIRIEQWPALAK